MSDSVETLELDVAELKVELATRTRELNALANVVAMIVNLGGGYGAIINAHTALAEATAAKQEPWIGTDSGQRDEPQLFPL